MRPSFEMELDRDLVGLGGAVCPEHCDDSELQDWIGRHASETYCSYCARESDSAFATDGTEFAEHVFRSLLLDYGGADDEGIPWDGREGGYQAPILDTWDILENEGAANDPVLLENLTASWQGQAWVPRHVWWLSEDQALAYGWTRFREVVLHERRYWFHLAEADPYEPSAVPPGRILPAVGEAIEGAHLLRRIPAGKNVFRAHTQEPGERLEGARRLGSPPPDCAAANRMSPAGISMFYGAEDTATAVEEARRAEIDLKRSSVTVATFQPARDLTVVDLCDVPAEPGLFDEKRAHTRSALRFLASFAEDVRQAVRRDGHEHVDYVPTQVFAEWLRFEFAPGGEQISGVRYRSAYGPGVCVALFLGYESAVNEHEQPSATRPLQLFESVTDAREPGS